MTLLGMLLQIHGAYDPNSLTRQNVNFFLFGVAVSSLGATQYH